VRLAIKYWFLNLHFIPQISPLYLDNPLIIKVDTLAWLFYKI